MRAHQLQMLAPLVWFSGWKRPFQASLENASVLADGHTTGKWNRKAINTLREPSVTNIFNYSSFSDNTICPAAIVRLEGSFAYICDPLLLLATWITNRNFTSSYKWSENKRTQFWFLANVGLTENWEWELIPSWFTKNVVLTHQILSISSKIVRQSIVLSKSHQFWSSLFIDIIPSNSHAFFLFLSRFWSTN